MAENKGHNAVALAWWTELTQEEREILIAMLFKMDGEDFREFGVEIDNDGNYIENF
jgi:hypothetical protein